MPSNTVLFISLLLILHGFEITRCELPGRIQTIETNDVDSLPDLFSSSIDKIKQIIHRFRCPEGWKRLGGSCYYFSNFTSTSPLVNHTCHHLHSNFSQLMKIQSGLEFLYAARVLGRNNLSMLMIEIDSHLLKGKSLADIIWNDRNRWSQIREKMIYQRNQSEYSDRRIINELKKNGFNVARRYRKPILNETATNTTGVAHLDQYQYEELDSGDEIDEFEQMENMHQICDDIHWNVFDSTPNTTTYILTKYDVSNRTICSLSDVETHTKYPHVCEYVLDYCFANVFCGKHGRCENTLTGFKCACSLLYGGLFCEKISWKGWEIIGSLGLIALNLLCQQLAPFIKNTLLQRIRDIYAKRLDILKNAKRLCSKILEAVHKTFRRLYKREEKSQTTVAAASPMTKYELIRWILIMIFTVIILAIILISVVLMYKRRFQIDMNGAVTLRNASHSITDLIQQCQQFTSNELTYLGMVPLAVLLVYYFSHFHSSDKAKCGRFRLLSPMEPFRTNNRGIITMVFASLAYEVLRSFEAVTFTLTNQLNEGIFSQLSLKTGIIILTSCLYYPILLSFQFKNQFVRCAICPYMIFFIAMAIIREGSCIGYLPLSGYKALLEESKLRLELGTWFIIYGLFKHTPQFFCLSYITAELLVRWLYDTIHMTVIKKQDALLANNEQVLDVKCALIYTEKFFNRQARTKKKQDRICDKIYNWDDEFCFSTMTLSSFTVAGIVLYYLACSFVFLYISRTTGHITLFKSYLKPRINTEKVEEVSLQAEIICSAVISGLFYAIQLLAGLKQFREDKKKLYRSRGKKRKLNFNQIASEAVHFPGFLIINMAWGFVITFHLILLLAIALRLIYSQAPDTVFALSIVVPVLLLYGLRKVLMGTLGNSIFSQKEGGNANKQGTYPRIERFTIFIYLCLFIDCFLGITSCLIRLIKTSILNVLLIGRLDWNFLSRPLEKWDSANNAYRSYLQMEVHHSHPIALAFVHLWLRRINKRPRLYYDDDCCVAPDGFQFEEDGTDSYAQRGERTRPNDEIILTLLHPHENDSSASFQPRKIQLSRRFEQNKTNYKKVRIQENEMPTSASRGLVEMSKSNNKNKPEDDSDDDGGIKVKPRSKTNVPPKPILKPTTTAQTDEEDEDGGVSGKAIAKQRKKAEEKAKQKEESQKKKQALRNRSLEDEDGAVVTSAKSKPQANKTKKKSTFSGCFLAADEGEDEDGAISKPKPPPTTTEKKKSKSEVKKKATELSDEEDGAAKRDKPVQKKTSNKPKPIEIEPEDDEDDDGGRKVKIYATIKKILPTQQPILNNPTVKDDTSVKTKKDRQPSTVPNAVDMRSNDTVPTEKDTTTEVKTNKPRIISGASFSNKIYLRTNSYTSAQENLVSTMSQQSDQSSLSTDSSTEEDHYENIPDDQSNPPLTNPVPSINQEVGSTAGQIESISDQDSEAKGKRTRALWYYAYTLLDSSLLKHSDDDKSEENACEETIPPIDQLTTIEISQDTASPPTEPQHHIDSLVPISSQEPNQNQQQQQTTFHSVHIEQTSTTEVLQEDSIVYVPTTHNKQTKE